MSDVLRAGRPAGSHRLGIQLVAVACMVVAAGCGEGFKVADVKGTVTLDGKPAAGVMVEFAPKDRGSKQQLLPPAYGFTDANGAYTARRRKGEAGAVVGMNRVSFHTNEGGTVVPEHYAGDGGFDREVVAGVNTFDFALESKPRK